MALVPDSGRGRRLRFRLPAAAERPVQIDHRAQLSAACPGQLQLRRNVAPPRPAALLRPENEMQPELRQTLRIFPKEAYLTAVTDAERAALDRLDTWFAERGARKGHG